MHSSCPLLFTFPMTRGGTKGNQKPFTSEGHNRRSHPVLHLGGPAMSDSAVLLLLLFLLGLGGIHVEFSQCVMMIWVLREHCVWADVIMWWWAGGREPKHTWLMGIQVHYGVRFTSDGLCFSRRTCLFKSSHFSHSFIFCHFRSLIIQTP